MNIEPSIIDEHRRTSHHRDDVEKSDVCVCIYCLNFFQPKTIQEWVDGGQTALCPKCGIDSVIGSHDNPNFSYEFFKHMHDYWFSVAA